MPTHLRVSLLIFTSVLLLAAGLFWALDAPTDSPTDASQAATADDRLPFESFLPLEEWGTTAKAPFFSADPRKGGIKATLGTAEDPHARLRFDWMRLRDPSTGRIPAGIHEAELAYAETLPKDFRKVTSWVQRGPVNVGGRTRALAYDVSDATSNTILAAGVSGGIWRTTDGGQTWTRTLDLQKRPSITSLAQDTRSGKTNVWYASTGERRGNSANGGGGAFYRGNGVYKSTDGGQSWDVLPSTAGEPTQFDSVFDYTWGVRTDPSNGSQDEVYVATSQSIVRSIDGGQSWTTVLGGGAVFPEVEVTSTGVVYATLSQAGSQSGIYRSPDGVNWTNITPAGFPVLDAERTTIGVNPSDVNEVWFVSYAPGNGPNGDDGLGPPIGHVLWKYDHADAGTANEWIDYSDLLPTRGDGQVSSVAGRTGDFNTQAAYDILVAVHPDAGNLIFVGGRNLWRLDTTATTTVAPSNAWIGGYTFTNTSFEIYQPTGSDRQHPDQHAVVFDPNNGDVMLTGSDGGVHRTDDNRSGGDGDVLYTSLNDGYYTTQFYHVCINADPNDPTLMGGMQDNGTWLTQSQNVSDDWTEELGGDGAFCEVANAVTRDGTARYPSAQNGQVARFDYDASGSFQSGFFVFPPSANGQLFIHPFELDPAAPNVMYYPGGTSMWRTQNVEANPNVSPGIVWEEITGAAPLGHAISAVRASDGNDAHVLYYGTVDFNTGGAGKVFRLDNAHTVDPSSASPVEITGASFPVGGYVSSIAVDPTDSDKVMVAFSNYNVVSLFYTSDGGQTWTEVEGNLAGTDLGNGNSSGPSIRWVDILPQPGFPKTTYYVGTSVGLYSTTSLQGSSTSWSQEGPTTIGSVVVSHVEARPADGLVVAGTHANGVFSSDVPLPVEFAGFDAQVTGKDVVLNWWTQSEVNNAAFAVEHRAGNGSFRRIHTLPGAQTTNEPQAYRYRVAALETGPHAFRIRQIDADGASSLSKERSVTIAPTGAFELSEAAPNPFRSSTRFRLSVREKQTVRVTVYNAIGQQVQTLFEDEVAANRPVDLSLSASGLSSGVYFVRVDGADFSATRRTTLVR